MQFHVPADTRFVALAPDVAAKYAELAGGTEADAAALAESVSKAIHSLGVPADADLHLSFSAEHGHVEVIVRGASRSATVRQPLPAPKA